MSLKKQIEHEQKEHRPPRWEDIKSGGTETNVGQVDGTGVETGVRGTSVGSNGPVGGSPDFLDGDEAEADDGGESGERSA